MPVELVKSPYKVCRIIGENVFSTVVEEDINVPDVNPDVYKILSPGAVVLLKDCEVLTDKVLVNGQVLINVLYSADLEGKPLSSIDISTNFSQSIEIPGVRPRMKEQVNIVIQHIECAIINSRKLSIRVIMDIKCKVEEIYELELAADVRGLSDIQILREPCIFKQLAGYNRDQYELVNAFELPAEKAEINRILRSDYRIIAKDDKVLDGRVEISGALCINVLYTSLDEENSVDFIEFEMPYTQYIEIPEADRNMESITDAGISQYYLEIDENEAGERRKLKLNAVMNVTAKVVAVTEEDVVSDAYSPTNKIEMGKEIYDMNEFVGKGHSNTVVKESMQIQHGDPEIEKICSVTAKPMINEVRLMDDKVVIEGMLDCTAIYMTSYSAEPMCGMNDQIPFKHYVDIPGTKLGMLNNVKCEVDDASYSLMNSEMIELRVVISIYADIWKKTEKKIVDRIEEVEGVAFDPSRIPAVTIYIAQKGDTMWSIAKRYNTTVDALVKLNNIDNPSKIHQGMQIMVLKNIRVGK
ncbi:MAG: DUF3794 and LysM peptidoglycan-binding domain-containing protein [Bacillota bacterium]